MLVKRCSILYIFVRFTIWYYYIFFFFKCECYNMLQNNSFICQWLFTGLSGENINNSWRINYKCFDKKKIDVNEWEWARMCACKHGDACISIRIIDVYLCINNCEERLEVWPLSEFFIRNTQNHRVTNVISINHNQIKRKTTLRHQISHRQHLQNKARWQKQEEKKWQRQTK